MFKKTLIHFLSLLLLLTFAQISLSEESDKSEENEKILQNLIGTWFKENEKKLLHTAFKAKYYNPEDLIQDTLLTVYESLQKISEKNIFYLSNSSSFSLSRQANNESEIFPGMRLIFIIKSICSFECKLSFIFRCFN